jgi:hypothetical protein
MFIGHYGVALALKKADPKLSLGTLFLGAQLVDILWGMFILLGWERARVDPGFTAASPFQFLYYPFSHSLVAGVFWAILAAAVFYTWPTKDTSHRRRGSLVLGIVVLSHWFLDLVVHIPDLPLASDDSRKVGLGLWDSVAGTLIVEFSILAIGAWLYAHTKTKRHPLRTNRLVILVVVLAGLYAVSMVTPPPTNMTVVGASSIVLFLGMVWLGNWVDQDPPPDPAAEHHRHKRHAKAA